MIALYIVIALAALAFLFPFICMFIYWYVDLWAWLIRSFLEGEWMLW